MCLKNNFPPFHMPNAFIFSLFCLYHYIFSVTLPIPPLFMASHSPFNISSLQYFLAACVQCGSYH